MHFFEQVPLAPPDPILGLISAFHADPRENKVNLGVGYYRDACMRTPIMACVKEVEKILVESESNKEYLAIDGHRALIDKLGALVFGEGFWESEQNRIAGFQTLGGTGALKVGGTFFQEEMPRPVLLPFPTWPNHRNVFKGCHLPVEEYPYYSRETNTLELDKMRKDFSQREAGCIVVLHASCHNPSGCDPTLEQWEELAKCLLKHSHIPFFDFAYQGLGAGVAEDAVAVRLFAEKGCEMCVAFSAAKNFSLYGERVGALFIIAKNSKTKEHIHSRVKQMIRANYSNPPRHGAAIVAHILSDPSLKSHWMLEVKHMRERIDAVRKDFSERLMAKNRERDFSYVQKGKGMFCMSGLTKAHVDALIAEYGIYMPSDGRINLCGISQGNSDYVINALIDMYNTL
ncbi:MAG TPA: amino acid aminotransferase [Rhabdochlamydiaceae bacterium]|jgi:aspartate/tyrosine/aromatic aminotransferase